MEETVKQAICNNILSKEAVLPCSVVERLTRNTRVLGSTRTGPSGVLMGVSLGKTLQSPCMVFEKPGKEMNNVNC